jgi:RNA polymerase sigma factor (sigma-70 family)
VSISDHSAPPGFIRTDAIGGNQPDQPGAVAWTDAEVIRASLVEGERFGEIFARHGPWVLGYVGRRIGPELAEDVTADTFATAFRIRNRFDLSRPDARPWLFGIAVRELSHRRRAERARYRMLASISAEQPVDGLADQVAANASAVALRGPMAAALAKLKDRDRDTLLLLAWADLSYAEVAEALGVPVGTVRSRLHRARRVVRECLSTNGIEEWEIGDE